MSNNDIQLKPFSQLLYLLFLMSTGLLLALVASYILVSAAWGSSAFENPEALAQNTNFLRLSQIIQVFFVMFAPSLLFLKRFGLPKDFELFHLPKQKILFLFAGLAMILCQPFIEWTATINHQMALPAFLSDTQSWMLDKEKEMSDLTFALLETKHVPIILINIAIMVILPAFCEELLFRGVLQNKLTQWWKNGHVAIIVTAVIFSAIHMQFFTFLPRLVMGITLGYLLYWGKSLWLPIIAHLVNNGLSLAVFYYYRAYQPEVNPLKETTEMSGNPVVYLSSLVLLIAMIYMVKTWRDKSLQVN
jgi:uncharacterized protein